VIERPRVKLAHILLSQSLGERCLLHAAALERLWESKCTLPTTRSFPPTRPQPHTFLLLFVIKKINRHDQWCPGCNIACSNQPANAHCRRGCAPTSRLKPSVTFIVAFRVIRVNVTCNKTMKSLLPPMSHTLQYTGSYCARALNATTLPSPRSSLVNAASAIPREVGVRRSV
jgi:hypothetical protein